jgi:hypothetical protein
VTGDQAPTTARDDGTEARRWIWLIPALVVLVGLAYFFRHIYLNSSPSDRWSNVGASATAVAALVAGAGLFFVAIQSRDSAAAAKASAGQARAAADSLALAQRQFNDQLDSGRRQQSVLIFENLTLGEALVARGRLAEALKSERPSRPGPLKLSDLPPETRDDVFIVMRRFQLADVMCLPHDDDVHTYVDQDIAFRLIGWDIAWWSGALTGAFGDSLTRSGLEKSWESLERLRVWAEKKDATLSTVRTRAEQWVRT